MVSRTKLFLPWQLFPVPQILHWTLEITRTNKYQSSSSSRIPQKQNFSLLAKEAEPRENSSSFPLCSTWPVVKEINRTTRSACSPLEFLLQAEMFS